MLTLLFLILLAICITGISLSYRAAKNERYSDAAFGWGTMAVLAGLGAGGMLVAVLATIGSLVNLDVIDARIALYEERNTEINSALAEMIATYMEYEGDTYERAKLADIDVAIAIQAFPDLQARPLVQQQIDTYMNNQKEIVQLKESKINRRKTEWLIHFNMFSKEDNE